MARAQGVACDVCKKFELGDPGPNLPEGWIKVVLPKTAFDDTTVNRERDICSDKCLERLGRERRLAARPTQPRKPSGQSSLDPALVAWLDSKGVLSRERGGIIGRHVKLHLDRPAMNCLVCQHERVA